MAASLITVGQLQSLTKPGLDSIQTLYRQYRNEWKQYMTIRDSYKAVEYAAEMAMLNGGARMAEGTDIPLGTMSEKFITFAQNYQYGVGFTITKISISDNLYKDYFPKGIDAITYNLNQVSENEAIALFDNAFSTANPEYVLADGQAMCSATHPTNAGTFSNLITPSEMNETSIEDMVITAQEMIDASGQRISIVASKYLLGIPNQFIVNVITGSQFDPQSSNNAVNPITYGDYVNRGFIVSHYMNAPLNFFLLTDYNKGLVHYMRQPLEIEMSTDQSNQNLGVYGNERYRNICNNARSVIGCQGN
jgi:hypothetical protein